MMVSLFSVFDPSSSIMGLPLNWMSILLGLMFMPYTYWVSSSRWVSLWNGVMKGLYKEFEILLGTSKSVLMFVSLFSLILFNNFLGLFPYLFTGTSHLVVTFSLSLPLWLAYMVYGWMKNTKHMFAHLVPSGTPAVLMPFMVLIETISNLIRPGTLAVRLGANMIAGHLLLSLMSGTAWSLAYTMMSLLLISQVLLLLLECAVAVIQSYVFVVLSTLYASEVE